MKNIKKGIYRSFKSPEMTYEVLGVASHSENPEQKLVVYKALYGEKELWVRPAEMFLEIIDRPEHNYKGPRFLMIEEK